MVDDELGRQELVDERDIVVERANLEELLPAEAGALVPVPAGLQVVALLPLLAEAAAVPAVLDVPEQLDAELVRVQTSR